MWTPDNEAWPAAGALLQTDVTSLEALLLSGGDGDALRELSLSNSSEDITSQRFSLQSLVFRITLRFNGSRELMCLFLSCVTLSIFTLSFT